MDMLVELLAVIVLIWLLYTLAERAPMKDPFKTALVFIVLLVGVVLVLGFLGWGPGPRFHHHAVRALPPCSGHQDGLRATLGAPTNSLQAVRARADARVLELRPA